jgi:hypothetical protein
MQNRPVDETAPGPTQRDRATAALGGLQRDRALREIAGSEAPEPPSLYGQVRPASDFDKKLCGAIIRWGGDIAAAYRDLTGLEFPTPAELRALREKWNRLTAAEAIDAGYANPSKDMIVAMLVEKALHSPSDAVQIAAASQLAAIMPGWKAPARSENLNIRGKMEDFVKTVSALTHEPGRAEKVSDSD